MHIQQCPSFRSISPLPVKMAGGTIALLDSFCSSICPSVSHVVILGFMACPFHQQGLIKYSLTSHIYYPWHEDVSRTSLMYRSHSLLRPSGRRRRCNLESPASAAEFLRPYIVALTFAVGFRIFGDRKSAVAVRLSYGGSGNFTAAIKRPQK